MEEWDEFTADRIKVVSFGTFVLVAAITRSTEVAGVVSSTESLRNDVVNNQRHSDHPARGMTVFAAMFRPDKNVLT